MRKIAIIDSVDGKTEIIETNVPICTIKALLDTYCVEESEDTKPSVIDYIREEYPLFYQFGTKNGIFGESFEGGIAMLAERMKMSETEMVDTILKVSEHSPFGLQTACSALAAAMVQYEISKK